MPNRPINITGSDTTTGNLTMSDNGTTDADVGDTIQWNVNPTSGVAAITGLPPKTGNSSVFDSDDIVSRWTPG